MARFIAVLVLLAGVIGVWLVVQRELNPPKPFVPEKPVEALEVLRASTDPLNLKGAAVEVCQSQHPGAIDELLKLLHEPAFWKRLDAAQPSGKHGPGRAGDYLKAILAALARVNTPQAEQGLLSLLRDKEFMADPDRLGVRRQWAAIQACGELRDPSQELLEEMEAQVKEHRGGKVGSSAIELWARMGTEQSCRFIEKHFWSPAEPNEYKKYWFTSNIMLYRTNPAIVDLYRRVLRGKIPDDGLRNAVVQSLFDYRPREWFPGEPKLKPGATYPPKPPAWQDASTEVLTQVVELAWRSEHLDLTDQTRQAVLKTRREIEDILAQRGKPAPPRPPQRQPD